MCTGTGLDHLGLLTIIPIAASVLFHDNLVLHPRLQQHLLGSYQCFDRIITRGLIRRLQYLDGATRYINERMGPLTTGEFLKSITENVHRDLEAYAAEHNVLIEVVENPTKEDLLGRAEKRVDLANPPPEGPLAIFKTLRWSPAWNNSKDGFRIKPRRVYHYEPYVWDRDFGLCRFTLCTYLPFTVDGYLNQHNWLREQLRHQSRLAPAQMYLNSFQQLPLPAQEFQALCDRLTMEDLDRLHAKWLTHLMPSLAGQHTVYLRQVEACSNLLFNDRTFASRHLTAALLANYDMGRPEKVAFYMGRRRLKKGETRLGRIHAQASVKIQHGNVQGKVYQKSHVIRVETTVNDVAELGLRKRDLAGVREKARAINQRVAGVLASSEVDPAWIAGELHGTPFASNMVGTRRIPKVHFWDDLGLAVFQALARQAPVSGFKVEELTTSVNDALGLEGDRALNSRQVSYRIWKLRMHGFVEKVEGTRKYRLTAAGEAFLRLWVVIRQEVVEPFLPVVERVMKGQTPTRFAKQGRPRADEALPRARAALEAGVRGLLQATGIGSASAAVA